jgi:PIN domain nuclease of toxin-antitoxin system
VHRDPWDRLIVAQAQELGAALVSADRQLAGYQVEVIW